MQFNLALTDLILHACIATNTGKRRCGGLKLALQGFRWRTPHRNTIAGPVGWDVTGPRLQSLSPGRWGKGETRWWQNMADEGNGYKGPPMRRKSTFTGRLWKEGCQEREESAYVKSPYVGLGCNPNMKTGKGGPWLASWGPQSRAKVLGCVTASNESGISPTLSH